MSELPSQAADFTPKADQLLTSPHRLATAVIDPSATIAQTVQDAENAGTKVSPDEAAAHAGQLAVEALHDIVVPEALAQAAKDTQKDIQEDAERGSNVLASFESIVMRGKETSVVHRALDEVSSQTESVYSIVRQMQGVLSQFRGHPEDAAQLIRQGAYLRSYSDVYSRGYLAITGGYHARNDDARSFNNQFEGNKQEADATLRRHQAVEDEIQAAPRASMEGHVLDAVADRGATGVEEHRQSAKSDHTKSEGQIDDTVKTFELTSETLAETVNVIKKGTELADSLPAMRTMNDSLEFVNTYLYKLQENPAFASVLGEVIHDLGSHLADAQQKLAELNGNEKQFVEATENISLALQRLRSAGE
jgi:hypothetical protein